MFIITGRTPNDKTPHRSERPEYTGAGHLFDLMKDSGYGNVQMYEERELWINGRRGCNACVTVTIYKHSIVATAEPDKVTVGAMKRALRREFPEHTFYTSNGADYLRVDADRWTGDNVAPRNE